MHTEDTVFLNKQCNGEWSGNIIKSSFIDTKPRRHNLHFFLFRTYPLSHHTATHHFELTLYITKNDFCHSERVKCMAKLCSTYSNYNCYKHLKSAAETATLSVVIPLFLSLFKTKDLFINRRVAAKKSEKWHKILVLPDEVDVDPGRRMLFDNSAIYWRQRLFSSW